MVFHAAIDILPLPALLDPQGKAVSNNLPNIGLGQLTNVRIGKHITLDIEAESRRRGRAPRRGSVREAARQPHHGALRIPRLFRGRGGPLTPSPGRGVWANLQGSTSIP